MASFFIHTDHAAVIARQFLLDMVLFALLCQTLFAAKMVKAKVKAILSPCDLPYLLAFLSSGSAYGEAFCKSWISSIGQFAKHLTVSRYLVFLSLVSMELSKIIQRLLKPNGSFWNFSAKRMQLHAYSIPPCLLPFVKGQAVVSCMDSPEAHRCLLTHTSLLLPRSASCCRVTGKHPEETHSKANIANGQFYAVWQSVAGLAQSHCRLLG